MFARVMKSPEIRELTMIGQHREHREKYWQTVQLIIDNIEKYLTVILQTKGSRTTVANRAYRTVLAACSGKNIKEQRIVGQTSKILVLIRVLYMLFVTLVYW